MTASRLAAAVPAEGASAQLRRLERRVARVLTIGSLLGVAVLAVGVAGMAATGSDPLGADRPSFDPGRLVTDLAALRPEGFIWLGLLILIATPAARVLASLVGFAAARDRAMALVAVAILVVIALGVIVGKAGA